MTGMENTVEKRKHPRVQVYTPISYQCEDSSGNILEQNMGVARDVSLTGVQIETYQMIQSKIVVLMFSDYKQQLLQARGKTVYCKKIGKGKYKTGIKLKGSTEANLEFLKALVKSYHYGKETARENISPTAPH
jgi:hypothetical protein